ncbi:hypothetical protein BU24DRAFT_447242 [Aaosphaeria arxii CBS 175.79]|uniref:Uncharacterized protein n=1 Tax=Aaosphaeria arxii CBS 175.79 TaxID=1450172 RepID=A0A6A5XZF1_9PLEO|nr:uncharacterized protein BU24DRAFT_447242 [Aaosphaeria arxii CBS 175.79]KAF2018572.1 hypothetical protein BU24DRAFT_447242 [Aaosphaeria arxii CBS 175.79]
MFTSRLSSLAALAAVLSVTAGDVNSVCKSFGVDFVDEGSYFINSLSQDPFTCVSTFKGCNADIAEILLVDPQNEEYLCSQVQTTPEDDPKLSTCPILKNQMSTGDWIILVLGNNDDGNPFAWERDIHLDVGPQATSTVTPTVTFNVTTTPVVTTKTATTSVSTSTVGPFSTVTRPSATASQTKTITPVPVTKTSTTTFTRTSTSVTATVIATTKTVTATCTVPKPGRQDKSATYTPTLITAEALRPTSPPAAKYNRYVRKTDRAVDYAYAKSRVEAAKARRDAKANADVARVEKRAPDAPTVTVTAATPASTTITYTGAPVTTTETVLSTVITTSTLPAATFYTGIFTSTITLPTQTKTKLISTTTTTKVTRTITASITWTTTITPTASVTACKKVGGSIGPARRI